MVRIDHNDRNMPNSNPRELPRPTLSCRRCFFHKVWTPTSIQSHALGFYSSMFTVLLSQVCVFLGITFCSSPRYVRQRHVPLGLPSRYAFNACFHCIISLLTFTSFLMVCSRHLFSPLHLDTFLCGAWFTAMLSYTFLFL